MSVQGLLTLHSMQGAAVAMAAHARITKTAMAAVSFAMLLMGST